MNAVKVKNPRRRWLRFGLRTLLVIVTLVAIAATWLGSHVRRSHREKTAIDQLLASKNGITLDILYASPFDREIGLQSPDQRFGQSESWTFNTFRGGPKLLTDALGVDIFKTVTFLQCAGISGRGNRMSYGGRPLQVIRREFGSGVCDEDMRWIAKLVNLRYLSLSFSGVTDKGLDELKSLNQLQVLDVSKLAVTNTGLTALTDLPELQELSLDSTDITDDGMLTIATIKKLKKLNVGRTSVTSKGIEILRQKLPDCEVLHDTL